MSGVWEQMDRALRSVATSDKGFALTAPPMACCLPACNAAERADSECTLSCFLHVSWRMCRTARVGMGPPTAQRSPDACTALMGPPLACMLTVQWMRTVTDGALLLAPARSEGSFEGLVHWVVVHLIKGQSAQVARPVLHHDERFAEVFIMLLYINAPGSTWAALLRAAAAERSGGMLALWLSMRVGPQRVDLATLMEIKDRDEQLSAVRLHVGRGL